MDKDRVVGAGKQMSGSIKETVGRVLGDAKLEADGKAEHAKGKLQNKMGGLKDAVHDAKEKLLGKDD